ncbi:MAG TPA: S41 family peptidase, partial [Anaerolineales bacterium]|nr:S41 family peptidase [Anaerolineales bacterium]
VDGQPEMGWIRVDRFSDKTAEELATVSQELADQGATRYILDLRNNGGGLVDSAVETASLVLDGGVVLYEQSKTDGERTYNASNAASVLKNAPLVVLVNHNTASAAEILAGAIAAQGRAPLIGQQTFGKGSVQFVFTLSDGSSVHITAKTWQTPDRQDLNGNGLTPTIAIEPGTDGQDPELVAAIEVLLEQR